MKKLFKMLSVMTLLLSINFMFTTNTEAAVKIMWGKTELKLGQIGKVTVLSNTNLVELESDGSLTTVRTLKKGEEYRVYSYKSNHGGLYGVGGGNYIQKNGKVKYETPSKSKLALLAQQTKAPVVIPRPTPVQTGFPNRTQLRKVYPNGVNSSHPAYESKYDRDKDGWACENN